MEREIRFRGINEFTGDFSFGFLTTDVYNHKRYIETVKGTTLYSESVKPKTIGQFTGLKDKKGVDIYEGDILKYTLNNGEIRFYKIWAEKGGFVINQFQDDFYKEEKDIQFWSGLSDMQTASWVDLSLEVIGNIHQNPELLKQ